MEGPSSCGPLGARGGAVVRSAAGSGGAPRIRPGDALGEGAGGGAPGSLGQSECSTLVFLATSLSILSLVLSVISPDLAQGPVAHNEHSENLR